MRNIKDLYGLLGLEYGARGYQAPAGMSYKTFKNHKLNERFRLFLALHTEELESDASILRNSLQAKQAANELTDDEVYRLTESSCARSILTTLQEWTGGETSAQVEDATITVMVSIEIPASRPLFYRKSASIPECCKNKKTQQEEERTITNKFFIEILLDVFKKGLLPLSTS